MLKKSKSWFAVFIVITCFWGAGEAFARNRQVQFFDHCYYSYANQQVCPEDLCELDCAYGDTGSGCEAQCYPKRCPDIPLEDCPAPYCTVMTDCAGEQICQFPMEGGTPACGDLAYEGQDVECCEGLVRRCGIEFYDGTCDLKAVNSIYRLPMCIPCGDGICTNFENACNCPEDCGEGEYRGFDLEATEEEADS